MRETDAGSERIQTTLRVRAARTNDAPGGSESESGNQRLLQTIQARFFTTAAHGAWREACPGESFLPRIHPEQVAHTHERYTLEDSVRVHQGPGP